MRGPAILEGMTTDGGHSPADTALIAPGERAGAKGRRNGGAASRRLAFSLQPKVLLRAALATTLIMCGLVVTGAIVRLSNSGLGCPTWPNCTPGHLVATDHLHAWIEFGNRLLTVGFSSMSIVVAVLSIFVRPRRKDLVLLSWGLVGGVFLEAVLGGVSVLVKLDAPFVMAHFIAALAIIWVGLVLVRRSADASGHLASQDCHPSRLLVMLARAQFAVLCLVIFAGTTVTGSGPHSGSAQARGRLPIPFLAAAQFHADMAWLFGGLTVGVLVALRMGRNEPRLLRWSIAVVGLAAVQGILGYSTYFSGDPAVLAGFHVAGATALFTTVSWFHLLVESAAKEAGPVGLSVEGPAIHSEVP